jgi:hypothetical protein
MQLIYNLTTRKAGMPLPLLNSSAWFKRLGPTQWRVVATAAGRKEKIEHILVDARQLEPPARTGRKPSRDAVKRISVPTGQSAALQAVFDFDYPKSKYESFVGYAANTVAQLTDDSAASMCGMRLKFKGDPESVIVDEFPLHSIRISTLSTGRVRLSSEPGVRRFTEAARLVGTMVRRRR